jgi:hypothetical protein
MHINTVLLWLSQPICTLCFAERTEYNVLAQNCRPLGLNPDSPEENMAWIFYLIYIFIYLFYM